MNQVFITIKKQFKAPEKAALATSVALICLDLMGGAGAFSSLGIALNQGGLGKKICDGLKGALGGYLPGLFQRLETGSEAKKNHTNQILFRDAMEKCLIELKAWFVEEAKSNDILDDKSNHSPKLAKALFVAHFIEPVFNYFENEEKIAAIFDNNQQLDPNRFIEFAFDNAVDLSNPEIARYNLDIERIRGAFCKVFREKFLDQIRIKIAGNPVLKDSYHTFLLHQLLASLDSVKDLPDILGTIVALQHELNNTVVLQHAENQKLLLEIIDKLNNYSAAAEATDTNKLFKHENLKNVVQNLARRANGNVIFRFNEVGKPTSYKKRLVNSLEDWNNSSTVFSLVGPPGVGKSFLAQEIALKYIAPQPAADRIFDIVWWIDAEDLSGKSSSVEPDQNADLKELATKKINGTNLFNIDTASPDWLEDFRNALDGFNYLLIFDNACDIGNDITEKTTEKFVQTYFPNPTPGEKQRIIVTSKNEMWQNPITLGNWDPEELRTYLNGVLKSKGLKELSADDQLLKKLYRECRGLPLEVPLLAAYIIKHNCTPTSYVALLDENSDRRGNREVSKIFGISYGKLDENARKLLNMIAFMAPDEIPLTDWIRAAQGVQTNPAYKKKNRYKITAIDVTKGAAQLEEYALIIPENDGELYSIHRVWQRAIIKLLGRQTNRTYATAIATTQDAANDFEGESYGLYRRLLPHVDALAQHFKASMGDIIRDQLVTLLRDTAKYSFRIGAVALALRLNDKAISLKPEDETLTNEIGMQNSHSLILRDHCEQAMELAENAFQYFSRRYDGPDKLKLTEKSRQCVAKVYQRQGDFDDAKEYMEICKKHIEKFKDEKLGHDLYSGILHDLGSIWWDEGLDYERSLYFFNEAIDYKEKISDGQKDLYLHLSKMIKGVVLGLMGDYDGQFKEHKEVYDFLEPVHKEYRRRVYTGYYLLHFGWDKLGWDARNTPESKALENYFVINEDAADILQGDVKSAIIKAIVDLRKAARADGVDIKRHYSALLQLLAEKKRGFRYLDDGTVSVSAVLDYALYLEDRIGKYNDGQDLVDLKAVIAQADAMLVAYSDDPDGTKGRIGYHRTQEIDRLYKQYVA